MKIRKVLFCSIEGCNDNFYAKGYCKRHYQQIKRNGEILNTNWHRKNNYVIQGECAILELYNKKGDIVGKTIIDEEDLDRVLKHKWYYTPLGYVTTTLKNHKNLFLHRYITNCPRDKVVDHINHITTDNRKNNLRICGQKENLQNVNKEIKGITKIKRKNNEYYIVQIKRKYQGCFKSLCEAEKFRDKILQGG